MKATSRFSLTRLANVGRWDLCANRAFYARLFLINMICALLVPLGLHSFVSHEHIPGEHYVASLALTGLYVLAMGMTVTLTGHTFHNLRTRQGRISELTLPATNMERFVWHVLLVLAAIPLFAFVSLIVADLGNWLMTLLSGADAHSLTAYFFSHHFFSLIKHSEFLSVAVWLSAFVLCNAWRYKSNIIITFFLFILIIIGTLFLAKSCHPATHQINIQLQDAITNVVLIVMLIGEWSLTYKLYRNARLSSRINP